jgi:DNA-directed RNA polymerase subunit RPC12/RpoP
MSDYITDLSTSTIPDYPPNGTYFAEWDNGTLYSCPCCGHSIELTDLYCRYCGKKLFSKRGKK